MQLVIAAITTDPCPTSKDEPFRATSTGGASALSPASSASASCQASFDSRSSTRSCGRRGPASDGSTSPMSSSSIAEKLGSGVASVRKRPCSLQYASTSATCSSSRPVKRR